MFGFLKKTNNRKSGPKNVWSDAPLRIERPQFVIGDVHGMSDMMDKLLSKSQPNEEVVFVGDLIDRGDYSANVLRTVFKLCANGGARCLLGNHEKMMLDFIDSPAVKGRRWLRNGGMQTVLSFGSKGATEHSNDATLVAAAQDLAHVIGPEILAWLRDLPLQIQNGNLWLVHAGANPNVAMERQNKHDLIWGHSDFFKNPRGDGNWVMVGHTVVDKPNIQDGRVSIDTGAYATGILTAARVDESGIEFIST